MKVRKLEGDWMTTTQVSTLLGVSATRVRQLAETGRLEVLATPLGRLFAAASVTTYAEERDSNR